jgi:predicted Zn-dependent protease
MKLLGLRWRMVSGVFAVFLLVCGCTTVPVTGRQQINMMSPGDESQLGLSEFNKMKKEVPISKDPAANALLQKVGRRIAAVATPDMPKANWEFVVFESKEANAFCLPGGKVGVYTGILPITKDEAGLATVIGHEVAHAVARHGGERMTESAGLEVIGALVGVASSGTDWGPLLNSAYGLGAHLGVALPHSRKQESDADHIGVV